MRRIRQLEVVMQINLSELFTTEGMQKQYQIPIEMNVFQSPAGNYPITECKPVELCITHVKNRNLEIRGSLDLHLQIPCDRCLEPVDIHIQTEIEKDVDMNLSEGERVENLDEQPYISGHNLDVDVLVCDELIVNMPMKVLCSEDCKGICNRCGANLNHGTCDCDVTELDPRMSVIRDIFKNFKEV